MGITNIPISNIPFGGWAVFQISSSLSGIFPPSPWRPPQWSLPQQTTLTVPATPNSPQTIYFFDAIMRADHDQLLHPTEQPVQNGASLVDHAYLIPARVVLDILMSDAVDVFQSGQYTSNSSKSVSAYQTMKLIQAQRLPLTLTTHLDTYQNMLIEEVRAADTVLTKAAVRMEVAFRQILLGSVSQISVSDRPQTSGQTNAGVKAPVPPTSAQQDAVTQFLNGELP